MDTTYNPEAVEHWYPSWEQRNLFVPHGEQPYCIMIPPPNVTGSLHMGHGFQLSLMDTLIRYHRMRGDKTLWQVGTDHAGIATQMVVERELAKQDQSRHDLGRDAFIDRVWEWKASSGNRITQQIRRLGASVDWNRERFTMDDGLTNTVQEVFIRLYREGLIYRGKRMVNWDPKFLTAISDLEVVNEEEQGHLWHIRYPLSDNSGYLTIATTRPETLLGDSAVAVHPDDERYKSWHGKTVQLPLCDREIPIICDPEVDQEFGTGCLKITPAHDFNDHRIGQRHQLPVHDIMTDDAHISEQAPAAYRGLERYQARQKIIDDLTAAGLLDKVVEHTHKIPRGDRSGVVIEPRLTDQWFVKMESLAEPAIDVVAKGKIKFIPDNWRKTYFQWLDNIEDWCISRQLWWGHRIPAWYDEQGQVYVGRTRDDVRAEYKLDESVILRQDDDVLDTWFSSALWPFTTLGWPEQTEDLATFYPTQVLVTGFDIIFFWVARMIMMGLKFTDQIPFREVYITGLIRDSEGQKMSKSKGNILDPLDLIDGISLDDLIAKRTQNMLLPKLKTKITKQTQREFPDGIKPYGVDAVRFTFCALASTGRDIRFDVARLEGYRNFCNKLWNASRFVLMNTEDLSQATLPEALSVADRWILDRLQQTIASAHEHLRHYRFDLLCQALYEFIWHEYCDWYLELSKPAIYADGSPEQKRACQVTLLTVLDQILRLLHPIMPFITEEIWQKVKLPLNLTGDSLMTQAYPEVNEQLLDEAATSQIEWIKAFIVGVRNIRGEMNISPAEQVTVGVKNARALDQQYLQSHLPYLKTLAKLEQVNTLNDDDPVPGCGMALVGEMEIHLSLTDNPKAQARALQIVEKDLKKVEQERTKLQAKLDNQQFMQNAPRAVREKVSKEHQQLQQQVEQLTRVRTQLTG